MDEQNQSAPTEENATLTKKQRRELKREEKKQAQLNAVKQAQRKSMYLWGGVLFGLGLLVWGIISFSGDSTIPAQSGPIHEITQDDHVKGTNQPIVTIIEYSDFQCPACAGYEPLVAQLIENYGDSVQFAYRHYPLRSIHPNAEVASRAAEAAALQGKFWEMHDVLFEKQANWSTLSTRNAEEQFIRYAGDLGLDTDQFKSDLESDTVAQQVRSDEQSALVAGLRGTPTFFIDGEQVPNPRSYEEFAFYVQNLIEEKQNANQ